MKSILILSACILLSLGCAAQTQVLENYNFDEGGYYLLGAFSESDHNELCDSIGEFYIDSIPILNQIKQEWTFDQASPRYACGYHYTIYICKDGLPVEHFNINLNCNVIVAGKSCFYFDSQKLRMFKDKLLKPVRRSESFDSISQGRMKRLQILSSPKLICTFTPDWINYEGEFSFNFVCPKETKDCLGMHDTLLAQLSLEVANAYPGEPFILQSAGGSSSDLFVNVKCNKLLADKFVLYPLGWNKWTPYRINLISYWIP